MEILGYLLAIIIGVSLGLIGGGGSILTMPVLVYVMGLESGTAAAYSLFIVGITALFGSIDYAREKLLDYKTALIFGIPSIIAVFSTRLFLVPRIPDPVLTIGAFTLGKDLAIMLLLALMMVAASISMIRSGKKSDEVEAREKQYNFPLIFVEGMVVGLLTGLVGAGGGFLIIPALVLLARLPMKQAVGTSLLIIAAKSLIGFTGDIIAGKMIDWKFLVFFSAFAVAGIFIGAAIGRRVSSAKLKPAFGWFVLIMGIYMIIKEIFFPNAV